MQEGKELHAGMQFVRVIVINGHACSSSLYKYLRHASTYRGIKGVIHGGGWVTRL